MSAGALLPFPLYQRVELNNYAWHDKKSNTPQDNYNHYIDAIRYAFSDLVEDNTFFVA